MADYSAAVKDLPPQVREKLLLDTSRNGLSESDPLWGLLLAQSELLKAFLAELPTSKPSGSNGDAPLPMMRSSQIESLASAIKSLPQRIDIQKMIQAAGQGDNPELTAFLDDWRVTKATQTKRRLYDQICHWIIVVVIVAGLIAAACLTTYLVTWRTIEAEADARIDRLISAQPSAAHVPLWLSSHQAAISLTPLKPVRGHPETRGILITPGDLKLSDSWVSTSDGSTVIPIQ